MQRYPLESCLIFLCNKLFSSYRYCSSWISLQFYIHTYLRPFQSAPLLLSAHVRGAACLLPASHRHSFFRGLWDFVCELILHRSFFLLTCPSRPADTRAGLCCVGYGMLSKAGRQAFRIFFMDKEAQGISQICGAVQPWVPSPRAAANDRLQHTG